MPSQLLLLSKVLSARRVYYKVGNSAEWAWKGDRDEAPEGAVPADGKAWRWQQRSGFWADTFVVLPTVPPGSPCGSPRPLQPWSPHLLKEWVLPAEPLEPPVRSHVPPWRLPLHG